MNEDRIYVVTKEITMHRERNVCVTTDPDQAKDVCDEAFEGRGTPGGKTESFIEVWESGSEEPEFVTRSHPEEVNV